MVSTASLALCSHSPTISQLDVSVLKVTSAWLVSSMTALMVVTPQSRVFPSATPAHPVSIAMLLVARSLHLSVQLVTSAPVRLATPTNAPTVPTLKPTKLVLSRFNSARPAPQATTVTTVPSIERTSASKAITAILKPMSTTRKALSVQLAISAVMELSCQLPAQTVSTP